MMAPAWPRGVRICMAGLVMLSGCGQPRRPPRVSAPPGTAAVRVVCGTPALAEIVFALGAGDRVAGVSDHTVWPPEALACPRIGGWMNPDRERLMVLRPDIILTQGRHERLAEFARQAGIHFRNVPLETLDDVLGQFEALGVLLGKADAGRALRARVASELEDIRQVVAGSPRRRTVLLFARPEGDLSGLTAVGPGTFLHELLVLAGGENIFADARGDYPGVSRESLLMRAPEVIIELQAEPMTAARRERLHSDWSAMASLPAVRDGRISMLTQDYLLVPGPRIAMTARRLAEAIHPECFHE